MRASLWLLSPPHTLNVTTPIERRCILADVARRDDQSSCEQHGAQVGALPWPSVAEHCAPHVSGAHEYPLFSGAQSHRTAARRRAGFQARQCGNLGGSFATGIGTPRHTQCSASSTRYLVLRGPFLMRFIRLPAGFGSSLRPSGFLVRGVPFIPRYPG